MKTLYEVKVKLLSEDKTYHYIRCAVFAENEGEVPYILSDTYPDYAECRIVGKDVIMISSCLNDI